MPKTPEILWNSIIQQNQKYCVEELAYVTVGFDRLMPLYNVFKSEI